MLRFSLCRRLIFAGFGGSRFVRSGGEHLKKGPDALKSRRSLPVGFFFLLFIFKVLGRLEVVDGRLLDGQLVKLVAKVGLVFDQARPLQVFNFALLFFLEFFIL